VTVELVFDPFDSPRSRSATRAGQWVRVSRPASAATSTPKPTRGGRHPTPATGIDYLALVQARHQQQTRRRIADVDLPLPGLEPTRPTTPKPPPDPGEQP
jgi:hypothetical protein